MTIHIRSIVALSGLIALTACASLSPMALTKLVGLNPLDIAPEQMSVAAVMPVPLKLRTGDVVLHFAMDAPAPYGPVNETLPLEIVAGDNAPGVSASPSFERIQVARIAQADVARLAAAQAKARAFQATGRKDGHGSISVTISGGCRDGAINPGALVAELYMRSKPDEDYFRMSSVNLRKLLPADAIAKLPMC
ncbi:MULTISPECIES: hypothetical protein [Hyphomicrobiales]|jgi:hypothetical protein|uniref:hypothetical protein n=1 Tax=Hyphomicrobiales TaxID=356 RepID=UPI00037877FE|nr:MULTISPECIES: hypothetical protein [Phyllobacteriaceae]MCX8567430.1 hypothetical protein [Aminobacter sp. MET-1]